MVQQQATAPILIRDATFGDSEILSVYMLGLAKETESLDLLLKNLIRATDKFLRRPQFGKFYVAYKENDPETRIGMIMINFETSVEVGGQIMWINAVYVHKDHR